MTKIKNKTTGEWEDVAGLTQSDVIRNPDWSRAVALSSAQLVAGYTASEDGIIVGSFFPQSTADTAVRLYVNDVMVAFSYANAPSGTDFRNGTSNVPVAAGDVIKTNAAILVDANYELKFIPYKVSVPNLAPETFSVVQDGSITFDRTGKSLMTIVAVQGESGSPAYLAGLTDSIPLDFITNIVGKTFKHCFNNDPVDRADIFTVTAVSGNMVTIKYLYNNYAYVTIA